MKSQRIKAFSLLLLLGIIWGSGFSIARYATTHGIPPLGYSFWQSVGPAIFLLFISVLKRELVLSPHALRYYLIAGVLGIALPNTNMYFAASHLPAGLLAVIVNTVPVFIYPMALLARQEAFNRWRLFGVLMGVLGIMLIVIPHGHVNFAGHWAWIALLTPFFFALCALYGVYDRPVNVSSLNLATGMLASSAIILLPLVIDSHEFYPLNHFSLPNLAVIVEIILSSIGYIILFKLLKMAGAVYYSLVGCIVAITGLFWGWLLFGETLTWVHALSVVLIMSALFIVTLRHKDP